MIVLTTPTYDLSGVLALPDAVLRDQYNTERRGSVTATLDGGVSVYDTGFALADNTWTTTIKKPTALQIATARYLIAYYAELILFSSAGVYVVRASMSGSRNEISLKLRLLSRLDA